MKTASVILAGVVGTCCMTLFSYLISKSHKRNFREPELLGKMAHRLVPVVKKDNARAAGWLLHFLTGIGFASVYKIMIKSLHAEPNVPGMLVIGGVSGIAAVVIWHTTFEKHPLPPLIQYKNYYGHLILTHVVFSSATLLVLRLTKSYDD